MTIDNASSPDTATSVDTSDATPDWNAPDPEIAALRDRLRGQYEEPEQGTDESDGDPASAETEEPTSEDAKPLKAAERARKKLDDRRLERENARLKADLAKTSSTIKEKEELIALATSNPLEALKLAKLSFPELVEKVRNGEIKAPNPEDARDAKLAELQKRLDERDAQLAEEARHREAQVKEQTLSKIIDEMADDFPLLASYDRAKITWQLLKDVDAYIEENPDADESDIRIVMQGVEDQLVKNAKPLISTKRSISALLKDAETRKLVMEELGVPDPANKGKQQRDAAPSKKTGTSPLARSIVPPAHEDDTATPSKGREGNRHARTYDDEDDTSYIKDLRSRLTA